MTTGKTISKSRGALYVTLASWRKSSGIDIGISSHLGKSPISATTASWNAVYYRSAVLK